MSVLVRPPLKESGQSSLTALKAMGLRALAVFLLLWTPFFVVVAQRGYPVPLGGMLYSAGWCLLAAAIVSALCGRAGGKRQAVIFAGLFALVLDVQFDWYEDTMAYVAFGVLLILFWVLRRHVSTILVAMFGAVLLSTAVFGTLEPYVEGHEAVSSAEAGPAAADTPEGIVVHLVLDEHAGIMGIPDDIPGGEDLRRDLRAFFAANGFRLFGNAISEYEATRNSMAGILNFTGGATPYDFYEGWKPYILKQNRYFEVLAEAGYDIRVYQSNYMEYCREFPTLVDYCFTYRYDGTDWLKTSDLDDIERLNVLLSLYLQRSDEMVKTVLKAYVRLALQLRNAGFHLPELPKWDIGPSSANAMTTFDRLVTDVVAGADGSAYFAHLLIPHGPYTYHSDCSLRRDVNWWRSNRPPFREENSESERQQSYAAYFEQVQCVRQKLGRLFEEMRSADRFDDATIIIHGDHGSRIYRVVARAEYIDQLQQHDYQAGFATLFAAKSAALEPGYDSETVPVSRLLPRAIGRPDLVSSPEAPIRVYLKDDHNYEPWTPVPWQFSE